MLLAFASCQGCPRQFFVLLTLNISNQVIDVMLDSLLSLPSPVGLLSTQAHTEGDTYRFITQQPSHSLCFLKSLVLLLFLDTFPSHSINTFKKTNVCSLKRKG